MKKVTIVDYNVGNIRSLLNALDHLQMDAKLVSDPAELIKAERVILPGVGAVSEAMDRLEKTGLGDTLKELARASRPILGVCLGMQLLCNFSEENGGRKCLELIDANVLRFTPKVDIKIPHIGWNSLNIKRKSKLLDGVENGADVYFVHSFYVSCVHEEDVLSTTEHGIHFSSMIANENVYGAQFHPEKSQNAGLQILKNFSLI